MDLYRTGQHPNRKVLARTVRNTIAGEQDKRSDLSTPDGTVLGAAQSRQEQAGHRPLRHGRPSGRQGRAL